MTTPEVLTQLPEMDREYLDDKGWAYDVEQVEGLLHVVLHGFEFPTAYSPRQSDLLVRLPAGYPNANPDMFWTRPDVKLASGAWPTNADYWQEFSGVRWQRWSRHFPNGRWRPGVDGLDTFIAAIRRELRLGR